MLSSPLALDHELRSRSEIQALGTTPRPASSNHSEDDVLFKSLIVSGQSSRKRNLWATVGSALFELLLLTTIIVVPLFHTEVLPKRDTVTRLYLPEEQVSAPPHTRFRPPAFTRSSSAPASAPVAPVAKTTEAPPTGAVIAGIPESVGAVPGGVLSGVLTGEPGVPILAKAPTPTPKRIRVAQRVVEANLIHDVTPIYPPEAGQKRIQGTVVLIAVIGKDGTVQDVRVESGLPVLAQAAIEAVKQWRYRPYLLNGEPVEVDSRITINFALSG